MATSHIGQPTMNNNNETFIEGITCPKGMTSGSYEDIPETKTFYPTIDQFRYPLQYIESIRDEGLKYGIVKIKPPKEWNPSFNLSFEDFKFSTKIQPIHLIQKRIENGSLPRFSLDELRHNFLCNLRLFLSDNGIDNVLINKKRVYLYDLYTKVCLYGGYDRVNSDRMWQNVATELGVEYVTNKNLTASYTLKMCYNIYLSDYEQCNNFPLMTKTITQSPKQRYTQLLQTKADAIRKIKPLCAVRNAADIDERQSCSVCGQFTQNYDLSNAMLECIQCGNRWHSNCHEPPISLQQLQELLMNTTDTERIHWCCNTCSTQKTARFGYEWSARTYSLNQYQQKAAQFKKNFMRSLDSEALNETEWENVFWSIVDDGCYPLSVEYGSEIPSHKEKTGFPMQDNEGAINYAKHEFNLMNIKNATGNILKHLDRDISGMTYPWIYVGMLFTAFGWHYEDHYAYSVNYNHFGAAKQWYGISSLSADAAEQAMKQCLSGTFEQFDLVTLVSPWILHKQYNIPIYKARQHPGEFIVTFPQAYHGGFNLGFNVAEAVNFCTADWLSFGLKCASRYKMYGRRQAFAHNELICNLCEKMDELDTNTLKWLFESFVVIYKAHYEFINTMLNANVTRGRPWQYDPDEWMNKPQTEDALDGTGRGKYDDIKLAEEFTDAECVECNDCLYTACVRCKCDPSQVSCHKHFKSFCECAVSDKWFEFRFPLTWFEQILNELIGKVDAQVIGNELRTDYSDKNYEILKVSSDACVVEWCDNESIKEIRHAFEERYGEVLGKYCKELVKKLRNRFVELNDKMSFEELNHLSHAAECVIWGHYADEASNESLYSIRNYFDVLCDFQRVCGILSDACACYNEVQSFYHELQTSEGQDDKVRILLENQPRFCKKLSLVEILDAFERVNKGDIGVNVTHLISCVPSIVSFIRQQEDILHSALDGILSSTWQSNAYDDAMCRTIVNFIPGNFTDSFWAHVRQLQLESKNGDSVCLALSILKWLLIEFERGILASIDCDAMKRLKYVLSKGHKLQLLITKYYEDNAFWLTPSQIQNTVKICLKHELRLPFFDFIRAKYNQYSAWDAATERILQKKKSNTNCNYARICDLVKEYKELRILNRKGDVFGGLAVSIEEWIQSAPRGNALQLLIAFEEFSDILSDVPPEYARVFRESGAASWIQMIDVECSDVEQINEWIQTGAKYEEVAQISRLVHVLRVRHKELMDFAHECALKLDCIRNKRRSYELNEYKELIQRGVDLRSINVNLGEIEVHVAQMEEWNAYLQKTLPAMIGSKGRKRRRSETKRRRIKSTFWWNKVIEINQNRCVVVETHPTGEQDLINLISSLEAIVSKSASFGTKCVLETEAQERLLSVKECVTNCNELMSKNVSQIRRREMDQMIHSVRSVLSGTLIENKMIKLEWKWHAVRYLSAINNNNNNNNNNKDTPIRPPPINNDPIANQSLSNYAYPGMISQSDISTTANTADDLIPRNDEEHNGNKRKDEDEHDDEQQDDENEDEIKQETMQITPSGNDADGKDVIKKDAHDKDAHMEIITASQIDRITSNQLNNHHDDSTQASQGGLSLQFASLGLTQDPQIQDIVSQMNAMNAKFAKLNELAKNNNKKSDGGASK
eukprot:49952_1